jgi:uncharacterized membrane protein
MVTLSRLLSLLGLLGVGSMAGLFYAYQYSVMLALDRVAASAALPVMQRINVVILNPVFFAGFMGTLVLLPAAAITAWLAGFGIAALWLIAAFLLYGLGTFGVTMAFNVPLNDALAKVPEPSTDPAADWARFSPDWNRWNLVRTLAAFASLFCVGLALLAQ